ALDACHQGTHHRQVDLVISAVQDLMGVRQGGAAMRAGRHLGGHRLVGIADQRPATAFAAQTAFARSGALGLLRPVRLLALRWRQAGIVRGFAGFGEPRLKLGNPPLGLLKALPQRPDQGVLLGVAQVVEVGKLGHPAFKIDSTVTASSTFPAGRCAGGLPWEMASKWGVEQLRYVWAPVGSRPPMVRDNRHDTAYIFGAICPARGVGAAVITPAVNTECMNLHLAEISTQVAPGSI